MLVFCRQVSSCEWFKYIYVCHACRLYKRCKRGNWHRRYRQRNLQLATTGGHHDIKKRRKRLVRMIYNCPVTCAHPALPSTRRCEHGNCDTPHLTTILPPNKQMHVDVSYTLSLKLAYILVKARIDTIYSLKRIAKV